MNEGSSVCVKMFCEVKLQIPIAQFIFKLPSDWNEFLVFIARKNGLLFQGKSNSLQSETNEKKVKSLANVVHQVTTAAFVLDGFEILPETCHGLGWAGQSELHFRLKVRRETDYQMKREPVAQSLIWQLSSAEMVARCAQCGAVLLHKPRFSRVLPLPSEGWTELTDTWFCHAHDDNDCHTTSEFSDTISPRFGDCLVGELHFTITSKYMPNKRVMLYKSNRVICSRCRQHLGIYLGTSQTHIQFSVTSLDISSTGRGLESVRERLENHIASLLNYERTHHNVFQHIVMSKMPLGKAVPAMLLWVLEGQSSLFQADVTNNTHHIKPYPVMKVLYRDCVRDTHRTSEILSAWQKNLHVKIIDLPQHECLLLLELLSDSTQLLPRSMWEASGFWVGYLNMKEEQCNT